MNPKLKANWSPEDADLFADKWCIDARGYARLTSSKATKTEQRLHRIVAQRAYGNPPEVDMDVDHINTDKLDNRRENLRYVTRGQNIQNRIEYYRTGSSTYIGVSWNKHGQKWAAYIDINHKRQWLGRFKTQKEAVHAYNEAALQAYGPSARLNNIVGE